MTLSTSAPDVILTSGAQALAQLLQTTRELPIVFALVADPVGAGFVNSLARPGGNATGLPDETPEKSAEFIEAECLKAARHALGCSGLTRVKIGPMRSRGSGPNWEVYGFSPSLSAIAHSEALKLIALLRQKYALKPSGKN